MIEESTKHLSKSRLNEAANSPAPDRQFRIFATLWAIATLFHMAHSSIFDRQLNLALLTIAAFVVILRPSLASFTILILLQIFDAVFRMPVTTNHWIFTAFANLTILQVLLFLSVRHRTFVLSEKEVLDYVAPVIRAEVILLYFIAAFHKLNSDFLLASTSCASELLQAQHFSQILVLNEGMLRANRYVTLVLEFALPILLIFRRTRNFGLIIGLFFHSVLSYSAYNAFYDFSSVMFATYFLFMGPEITGAVMRAHAGLKRKVNTFLRSFSLRRLAVLCAGVLFGFALLLALNRSLDSFRTVHLYFFWTLYSLLFCGFFIWHLSTRKKNTIAEKWTFRPAHWSLYLMPLIVFLNGMSPYLGLKTENSFAMFSNLRTEGSKTNHLIIPVQTQIFDYQKYIVEISFSTDTLLQRIADERKAMVLFEFQNYVLANRPDSVLYTVNGQPGIFLERDIRTHAALGENPYIMRKLLKFRAFSPVGPQVCGH